MTQVKLGNIARIIKMRGSKMDYFGFTSPTTRSRISLRNRSRAPFFSSTALPNIRLPEPVDRELELCLGDEM